MSVDGTWNITLNTPMGAQSATLTVTTSNGVLTGSMSAMGGSVQIADGKANGDQLTWKASLTRPMPITLEFNAQVQGNQISGHAKLGSFGSAPFSGSKA